MAKFLKIGLLIALSTLCLDQFSKWFLLEKIGLRHGPEVEVTSFFNLVMVWNQGVSFGMFQQDQQFILVGVALLIIFVLLRWLTTARDGLTAIALGLVIGGAAGNITDRLRLGAVADFFDFHWAGYHWPAFNIADATIFIGVVILCGQGMFSRQK